MKKIVLIISIISLICSSCNGQTKSKKQKKEPVKTEKKVNTISLTKADFLSKVANFETNPSEWKYLGDKPAIIDFYASWCGPCKVISPILEELATEYKEKIYIYKIDIEKEEELAALFGVQTIPLLLFIPMKETPQMARGVIPKPQLQQAIEEVLLKNK